MRFWIKNGSHLNVFELIELLQKVELEVKLDIANLKRGDPPKPRRAKYVLLDRKIKRLIHALQHNQLTLWDYLRSIEDVFHLEQ